MSPKQLQNLNAEARLWLGTPYHSGQGIRGVGVDCVHFPAAVYAACGLIRPVQIPAYSNDWHLQRGDELYINGVVRYADEVDTLAGGDLVLMRYGRTFSHGAIHLGDGVLIHAVMSRPVELVLLDDFSAVFKRFFRVRV